MHPPVKPIAGAVTRIVSDHFDRRHELSEEEAGHSFRTATAVKGIRAGQKLLSSSDNQVLEKAMSISEPKSVTVPEIALIAATRGAIGFGAGLLLASKFKRERRRVLGWTLFLSGLASTIPIAMHVFGKKEESATAH